MRLGGARIDPEILAMLQQGSALSTSLRVIVASVGDATLDPFELRAAREAGAPDAVVAAICDNYEAAAAQSHAPQVAAISGFTGTVYDHFWLGDAVSARFPPGTMPSLAVGVRRIHLDRYRAPGGMVVPSEESTVLVGARDANRPLDPRGWAGGTAVGIHSGGDLPGGSRPDLAIGGSPSGGPPAVEVRYAP